MFTIFRKSQAPASKPAYQEIAALRCAELLGMKVLDFHAGVSRGLLPVPLHREQPPAAWRWSLADMIELAAQYPQGLKLPPEPPRKTPPAPATLTIRRAAELLMMPVPALDDLVNDPKAAPDVPRRVRTSDTISNRLFVSRVYRWAEAHRSSAIPAIEDFMRTAKIAFRDDGQVYGVGA